MWNKVTCWMEMAFNVTFFNSAKFFNNAQNQLEFTTETRFARYRSKFSLILGIKKNFASLKKILTFYASSIQQISIVEKLGFFRYTSVFLNWASGLNLNSHELVTILVLVLKGCVWFSFLFILNWGLSRGQVLVSENVFLLESKIMSLNFERRDTKSL